MYLPKTTPGLDVPQPRTRSARAALRADAEDDIADMAAIDQRSARLRATGEGFVDLGLEAEGGDLLQQARTNVVLRGPVDRVRDLTLRLYAEGAAHAESCGIIVADTKFEFGLLPDGELRLIDEMLTPDSSRFWPSDGYAPGGAQPSFDKQYVRDYLESIQWNKQPPVPSLPDEVVARTREKYVEAFRRLTGRELA